ncbi:DNA mismatch repair protein [Cryobacterium sp. 1639]|uniref:DNA mismatch repair protein n=1 Tax=Cryobacterium inferilacus TaxID=2866629 RepID=UPI001C73B48D|nr:DNA mismatch repair protein [Cryobacterium sp. 1639]MBX0298600.1 DNA mismatch repair protein [Cryobacterium sp. 1639]
MITLSTQPRPTTIPVASAAGAASVASVGAVAHASGRNAGPTLVSVRDGLWRVVDRTGAVLGHIERQAQADGDRYLARRIVLPSRRMDLGAFWRIDEAADCFR